MKAKKAAKSKRRRIQQVGPVEAFDELIDENNNEMDILESAGDFLVWAAEPCFR